MNGMTLLVLGALGVLAVGSVLAGYGVAAVSWWLARDRPPLSTRVCTALRQCRGDRDGLTLGVRSVAARRSGLRPGS